MVYGTGRAALRYRARDVAGEPAARQVALAAADVVGCAEHDEAASEAASKLQTSLTVLRGRGLAPPPPAKQSSACQDQAGDASADDWAGNCTNLLNRA